MKDAVLSIIRHGLTVGGTFLATGGYIDGSSVEGVVGAVITLVAFVWGVWDKRGRDVPPAV